MPIDLDLTEHYLRTDDAGPDVSDAGWRAMQATLSQLLGGDAERHLFLRHYFGLASSTDATPAQRRCVRNWLDAAPTPEGLWAVSSKAWQSAPLLIARARSEQRRAELDAGQMELL